MVVALPMLPVVLKTRGVKDPFSTSTVLCSYDLFFIFSWWLRLECIENFRLDLAKGLNTLTSKNAICLLSQKSLATMSTLAWSWVVAVLQFSSSPVRGCNPGSSWHRGTPQSATFQWGLVPRYVWSLGKPPLGSWEHAQPWRSHHIHIWMATFLVTNHISVQWRL